MKGRITNRRKYVLDGREISSRDVLFTQHRARKDKYDPCSICMEEIHAEETYFQLNTFDGLLFHRTCYLKDHIWTEEQSVIVGVSSKTFYLYGFRSKFWRRTKIICKEYVLKDLN